MPDITRDPFMVDLLNNACSNSAYDSNGKRTEWSTYRIETHCTAFTYTAQVFERDDTGLPTAWFIAKVDIES